jgi:hypothetical protein
MSSALGVSPAEYSPARKSVVNGLATIFNIIALTVGLVVLSLTVVALPLAWSAASTALYDWRQGGESRVMRTFWMSIRTRPRHRTGVLGPAMLGTAGGVVEVAYFLHYRDPVALLCLTIGLVTVVGGVSFTSYLLLLLTVAPDAGWTEIWRCAAAIVGRTSVTTTPVFVVEAAIAGFIGYSDPGLLVVAIPVVLLWCWLRTAIWGARRAGLAV